MNAQEINDKKPPFLRISYFSYSWSKMPGKNNWNSMKHLFRFMGSERFNIYPHGQCQEEKTMWELRIDKVSKVNTQWPPSIYQAQPPKCPTALKSCLTPWSKDSKYEFGGDTSDLSHGILQDITRVCEVFLWSNNKKNLDKYLNRYFTKIMRKLWAYYQCSRIFLLIRRIFIISHHKECIIISPLNYINQSSPTDWRLMKSCIPSSKSDGKTENTDTAAENELYSGRVPSCYMAVILFIF